MNFKALHIEVKGLFRKEYISIVSFSYAWYDKIIGLVFPIGALMLAVLLFSRQFAHERYR
jgi:hypothetical protein